MRESSWIVAILFAAMAAPAARAGSIDGVYAFGDSLSDVGNVYLGTGGTVPATPYVNGQFTNGNVWIQDLASDIGLPPVGAEFGGWFGLRIWRGGNGRHIL
jgi:phospholipase/lecithinase/hemolysin